MTTGGESGWMGIGPEGKLAVVLRFKTTQIRLLFV
jgi:uncharacterized protein with NRDE domain